MANEWMLYGATGYTGTLLAEEAVQRGHKPLLAGRSAEKLAPLAERLGLPYRAFELSDTHALEQALEGVGLVFHAAGPFAMTAAPMRSACLKTGTHYLDITGELNVFEATFQTDPVAHRRGIVMMSGAGIDVIPSDCLAKYVADQLPDARYLQIGIYMGGGGQASAGTAKSALEILRSGGLVRRNGKLVPWRLGTGARSIRFPSKERQAIPFPWGDLATGYHSTSIPNITTFLVLHPQAIRNLRYTAHLARIGLSVKPIRRAAQKVVDWRRRGQEASLGAGGKTRFWAQVSNSGGDKVEAWLETLEGYRFTALAGIRTVERVFETSPVGALAPSQVLGADFVLGIDGTTRYDHLD